MDVAWACLLFVASLVAAAPGSVRADRQAHALAALSVTDAEDRLVLDWATVLRHNTFYKAVFHPDPELRAATWP